jgi:hypothetical protein
MSATSLNETVVKPLLDRRAGAMRPTGAERVEAVGRHSIRYGLVLVLLWIGGMKFTAYEAAGISGFVANSPLLSWVYSLFSVQGFSAVLGATEIVFELSAHDPWHLGGSGRRVSGAVGSPRTVPRERLRVVRSIAVAVRPRLASGSALSMLR